MNCRDNHGQSNGERGKSKSVQGQKLWLLGNLDTCKRANSGRAVKNYNQLRLK